MNREYEILAILIAGEKIVAGITDGSIKRVLHDIFVSKKSILEISVELINSYTLAEYSSLQKKQIKPILFQIQIGCMAFLVGLYRCVVRFIIMNIPIAVYLAVFDHYDNKCHRIMGSKGIFDTILVIFLVIILIWTAQNIIQEAVEFRQTYFEGQGKM